jgi:hypothetical protein
MIDFDEPHEPKRSRGMVALAHRCTRLRAGFVVHRKTDSHKGPQAQPAALFFFWSD